MVIQVLYHYPCTDGVFGALAAYLHFSGHLNKNCRFVGFDVGLKGDKLNIHLDSFNSDDTLFLIDYCGPPGFLVDAARRVDKVVLLDHHESAQKLLDELDSTSTRPSNLEAVIDMKRSGATIALDYYFSEHKSGFSVDFNTWRDLVEKAALVEDYDVWRHALPDGKPFAYGFKNLNLELDHLKNPEIFETLLSLKISEVVESGKKLVAERDARIKALLCTRFNITLSDGTSTYWMKAVMSSDYEILSDLGHELAKISHEEGMTAVGAVLNLGGPTPKISLRSVEDFNTVPISKHYGGGGHPGASAFTISNDEFDKLVSGS